MAAGKIDYSRPFTAPKLTAKEAAFIKDPSRTSNIHGKPFAFKAPAHKAEGQARVKFIGEVRSKGYKGATMKHLGEFARSTGAKPPRAARFDRNADFAKSFGGDLSGRDNLGRFSKD